MGGLPNFLKQHNPGKTKARQLALEKKKKLEATQRSQPFLQSFFTERPKELVPPTVPILRHVIAHVVEPSSSVTNIAASSRTPVSLVNTLLGDLEKAQPRRNQVVHNRTRCILTQQHSNQQP